MRRAVDFMRAQGSVPAIQLAHAGRKASMQRPWHGNGPMNDEDTVRGEAPWPVWGPTTQPLDEGWLEPKAMTTADIASLIDAFVAGTNRALDARF